jgi:chemotaxis protein CheD
MKISKNTDDVLVTYSLGSCVGLALYDPVAKIGGLVHCMLPLSSIDPAKAKNNPCMFTDTGVPTLIQEMLNVGAVKNRLIAKVAGAASLLDEKGTFKIGERNYIVLRKVLWKNNILIAADETGGTIPRTVFLYMDTGRTTVKSRGEERELA